MPSWKKVIVSGSDARINSLFTSGHVTASGNISGSTTSTGSFGQILVNGVEVGGHPVIANDSSTNSNQYITFVYNAGDDSTPQQLQTDAGIRYNPAINLLTTSASYSNIAKEITITSDSANSNKYLTFVDGSGTRDLHMDAGIRYNPSTNQLTTSASYANIAKEITITSDSENSNKYVTFVDGTGTKDLHMDAGIRYNPASNQLTVSSSYANIAKEITITSDSDNSNKYVTFVDGSGTRDLQMDAGVRYNPSTNQLTVSSSYSNVAKEITITSDSENSNKYLTFVDGSGTRDLHMDAGIRYNPASNQLTVSASYANIAKEITITSNSTNSNKYVTFADGSGTRDLQMDAGIRYNPSTNQLIVSSSYSNVAKEVTVTSNSTNSNQYVTFVAGSGTKDLQLDAAIRYNPSTNLLTANVVGDLTGNADTATTATTATNVVITDNEGTDEDNAIVFVANADVDGSTSIGLESDGDLKYNPSTGRLTATQLAGDGSNITNLPSPPIDDIGSNFGDNNRLITAAGANAVNAEENLTFDGSTLAVTGAVTVSGNLSVSGTTTTVNSTEVSIGDRILELNSAAAGGDGGIYVRDHGTAQTGSLLWDTANDYWKAGLKDNEVKLVTISSADTLENKSMSGDANTFTNIPNTALSNDGITIAGVDTSLGGTITSATILNGTSVVSSSAQVKTLLPVGTVSGSSIASSAQGEVALTTNGVAASAVDLGLQTTDTPTFAGLTINGNIGVTGDVTLGDALGDDINLNGHLTGSVGANISASFTSTGSFGRVQGTTLHGDGSGITNLPSPPIDTISNFDTNDRLITVAGANSVNAEPNLTFDGSELLVNGSVSGSTVRAARALYVAGYAGGAGTVLDIASIGSTNWFIGQEPNFTPVTATQQNLIIGQGPVSMTSGDNVAVVMRNGGGAGSPRTMRGGYNTIMGSRTAQAAKGKLTHSVIIGASAAHQIVSSSYNTIIGQGTAFLFDGGISNQSGDGGFPYYAGTFQAVPNGEDSTYYEDRSKHNVFIGHNAATFFDPTRTHTTLEHTVNVPIAFRSGSYNTFVGDFTKPGAGFTQFETVLGTGVIGHGSYTSTIGSGSLYVSSQGDGNVYAGMFTGSSVNVYGNITGSNISASGNLHGTIATTTQNSITSATSLASIGTITTGVWNGTAIASQYLDSDTAHLTTDQTFTGNKTFSASITASADISGSSTSTGSFGALNIGNNVLHANIHTNRVGVHTTNPLQTFHVQGSGRFTSDLRLGRQGINDAALYFEEIGGSSEFYKFHSKDGNLHISQSNLDDSDKDRSIVLKSIADDGNSKLNLTLMHGDVSGSITSTGSFGKVKSTNFEGTILTAAQPNITSLGTLSSIDIDGGNIDGTTIATSDITVGSSKTLDVSNGTLTLADDQISGNKVEGGTIDSTTITTLANTTLTSTTIKDFTTVSGSSISTGSFGHVFVSGSVSGSITSTGSFGRINSSTIDIDSIQGNWTNAGNTVADLGTVTVVNIDSGTIDGTQIGTSDITVGTDKTLDVSDGTLTLADDQISGDKVEGGTIASTTITSLASTNIVTTHLTASNDVSSSITSTGSFGFLNVPGDAIVGGTLRAQEFHTEFVSASIMFESGSTKFGDTPDDTHTFSGSLQITGSVTGSPDTSASFGHILAIGNMEAFGTGSFRTLEVVEQLSSQGRTFSPGYTSTDTNVFVDTDITGRLNVVGNITGSNFSGSSTSTGSFGRVEMSTGKVNGDFSITDDLVVTDDAQVGGVFSATGNTIFGNASSDTHTFTGHITSSGHISSSFTSTGSFGKVHGTTLNGTISTAAQPNITSLGTLSSIDIDGGNIDGTTIATSDITVGGGKTLDVSAGTLTTSAAQNLAIIQGGSSNVDIGSFSLTAETLVSDVSTGTAPFTVSSTTAVSNLNADLLDGNHGSHYTDFTNMTVEAGEVTNTMLENDSVSFGGVEVDLGNSDTTPAFNLQDATAYPGDSSLITTGTVTTGVWDSTFGSTSRGLISGSLGPNASTIRTLTKAGISGSVTELSSSLSSSVANLKLDSGSFSTRVTDLEDNTNDVTLAGGSKDYITLSGQVLTINQVDLADDVTGALPLSNTALVAGTNITLDTNTLNVDDAFLKNDADDSTSGKITAGGFITSGHVTASLGVSGSVSSTGSFGRIETAGNIVPKVHNVSELGSPTNRWANIYSADLQLSNEDNEVGNEIDGTKGSWTIQEGEDDLYLLNRKNGKKYRFKLEEIT